MQNFHLITRFYRFKNETATILSSNGRPYSTITILPDYSLQTVLVAARPLDYLDALTAQGSASLFRFVTRRHAVRPSLTPSELMEEFVTKVSQLHNPANREPRGQK